MALDADAVERRAVVEQVADLLLEGVRVRIVGAAGLDGVVVIDEKFRGGVRLVRELRTE